MRGDTPHRPPRADLPSAPPSDHALPGLSAQFEAAPDLLASPMLSFFDGLADPRELAVWGAWREGRE